MPLTPPSEETRTLLDFLAKFLGYFFTFIGGIVAATYAITVKIHGYETRVKNLENAQENCPWKSVDENILNKIEKSVSALHKRIDAVLLYGKTGARKENRGENINEDVDED